MKYENVYSYEYTLDTSFNMFRCMNVFGFGKDIEMHAAHRITKTSYHILLCLLCILKNKCLPHPSGISLSHLTYFGYCMRFEFSR